LNIVGLVLIGAGLIFLIYSIICKNKVNIYNRSNDFIILNKQKFLNLQLYFSILNSICAIILGLIVIKYNLISIYIALYPLVFHLINYLIKLTGEIKKYIKYK
jgi:hypothetical protein